MKDILIIGGGPAGLAAGLESTRHGLCPLVVEKADDVGGLCRTYQRNGFRYDVGGHRFFSKSEEIRSLWRELLGEDLLERPRLSRIYYDNKFFHYPLQLTNAVTGLGLRKSVAVFFSYLGARMRRGKESKTFEEWVSRRFGPYLFRIFFKTYTEKVWGIPCSELGADWAAQRIKNLSLVTAVLDAISGARRKNVATLIKSFSYPRLGPGMMSDAFRKRIEEQGGEVRTGWEAVRISCLDGTVKSVTLRSPNGHTEEVAATRVVNTMPITDLVAALDPPPPSQIVESASTLRYRDFLSVNLEVHSPSPFPDKWIYVHSPAVKVGRVQSYGNWSEEMIPSPDYSGISAEYFCFEGDEIWSASDETLVDLAVRELSDLGLISEEHVAGGFVVRVGKAYPMYQHGYSDVLARIRDVINGVRNLETVGRAGMFRYNNMDHSILTGLAAVRRLLGEDVDVWDVNADDDYLEA